MSTVSLEELTAEVEAPPGTLLASLARAVRRERGRRRLFVGTSAAAAAVLIAVGATALSGADSPARPPIAPSTSTTAGSANLLMSAVIPSPVTASARLVEMVWGTRIDLTCSYSAQSSFPADGYPYALVVIDRNGGVQQVATWKAVPDRQLTVLGASSLARKDIAAVEVRTLSGRPILRLST